VFKKLGLASEVLGERYQKELRLHLAIPTREDLTLKLWIEMFEAEAKE